MKKIKQGKRSTTSDKTAVERAAGRTIVTATASQNQSTSGSRLSSNDSQKQQLAMMDKTAVGTTAA